ncbi:MAG: sugar phosphate isomerase/epimerase [bacterium]|nr:sugar phosphate isomerase/epimerase [bacterium]
MAGIREFSEKNRISLSLHPPFNMNLCSQFPWVRHHHIVNIKKYIQLAHELNAGHLTLHLGNFYRFAAWANPRQHALERLLKVLRKVLPTCEKHKVALALENMVPIPPEAGYTFLGDNIPDFQYIFSRVESEYLKFCLDIGHANTAEGAPEYVEKLSEKIISVHFHDNQGQYDQHLDVGKGTVPWKVLISAFEKIDFRGPYVSECFHSQPHEAIELIKNLGG